MIRGDGGGSCPKQDFKNFVRVLVHLKMRMNLHVFDGCEHTGNLQTLHFTQGSALACALSDSRLAFAWEEQRMLMFFVCCYNAHLQSCSFCGWIHGFPFYRNAFHTAALNDGPPGLCRCVSFLLCSRHGRHGAYQTFHVTHQNRNDAIQLFPE